MQEKLANYEQEIITYYETNEASYVDGWDLNNSYAMHYGYKDASTKTFGDSLKRMNEVLAIKAGIKPSDKVLDAGCGVGGSTIYLARKVGCHATGITLSQKQVDKANRIAIAYDVTHNVHFEVMSYMRTTYADATFDVVWALESSCYASDKAAFVQEAYRILKPGGRLIIADGMVTQYYNNDHPTIKKWLLGWRVNYLESPDNLKQYYTQAGLTQVTYTNITKYTKASSKRLLLIYFASTLWGIWRRITFRYKWTKAQEQNISACYHQYVGMKRGLWGYGIVVGTKP